MQAHPGVFVSNISTEEWQSDPEIGGAAEENRDMRDGKAIRCEVFDRKADALEAAGLRK